MVKSGDIGVLIVAAGRGARAGGGTPKQYRYLAGKPVLSRTIEALAQALPNAAIACVIHPDDAALYEDAIARLRVRPAGLAVPAHGGATRQASVRAGLELIKNMNIDKKILLIHDSVRPFLDFNVIEKLLLAAGQRGAAIPGIAVVDALKHTGDDGLVTRTVEREGLFAVQTPQAFDLAMIYDAHHRAASAGVHDLADDAAVAEWAGQSVAIVPGSPRNIKLTTEADFARAEAMLMMERGDIRVGAGFDVHAFTEGSGVWLGGVNIPFDRKLAGHSDADVALHALTDALLGAIGDGDIGTHFPPSSQQWKDAPSHLFLRHAAGLVAARDGVIAHLDVTIICEAPKVGPHREAIRQSIAVIAGISVDRVSVKATTTERLGFTGRGEGIAAHATATVRLPLQEAIL